VDLDDDHIVGIRCRYRGYEEGASNPGILVGLVMFAAGCGAVEHSAGTSGTSGRPSPTTTIATSAEMHFLIKILERLK
jgi:hypothetical protein